MAARKSSPSIVLIFDLIAGDNQPKMSVCTKAFGA
jgi:hypothetical protein